MFQFQLSTTLHTLRHMLLIHTNAARNLIIRLSRYLILRIKPCFQACP